MGQTYWYRKLLFWGNFAESHIIQNKYMYLNYVSMGINNNINKTSQCLKGIWINYSEIIPTG